MRIIVEVPDSEAKRITEEAEAVAKASSHKTVSPKEAPVVFAQDLINRYFSTEYLDTDIFSK